ncbi:pro-resilin-like [Hetaerina americana]|uniref:pro-resilin-like n=1 Tax=Hetaerina americana TaxID=62018 RepID=UPI003A7F466D
MSLVTDGDLSPSIQWFPSPLVVVAAACLTTFARGDDDGSFGVKIPAPGSRGPRDVSTLSLSAPSSNYGAPGTPPPFRGQNTGRQPAFRPPPPPSSSYGPPQTSYGPPQNTYNPPPPPQNNYGPPSPPQKRPPNPSYGTPVGGSNLGGQFGSGGQYGGGHHQEDHSQWVPQPYEFSYSVVDAYTGNDYSHSESGDGSGNVRGEYRVLLPDGRTQIVTYTATDQTGYNAQVTYQGEARPAAPGGGATGGGGGGGYYTGNTGSYTGQGGYNQGQQQHHSTGYHQGPYRK